MYNYGTAWAACSQVCSGWRPRTSNTSRFVGLSRRRFRFLPEPAVSAQVGAALQHPQVGRSAARRRNHCGRQRLLAPRCRQPFSPARLITPRFCCPGLQHIYVVSRFRLLFRHYAHLPQQPGPVPVARRWCAVGAIHHQHVKFSTPSEPSFSRSKTACRSFACVYVRLVVQYTIGITLAGMICAPSFGVATNICM